MRFQDALESARLILRALVLAIIILFISNLALIITLAHMQSKVKVYIPPQIPANGLTMTTGEIPASTIYSFAFWAWQSINYWPKNGGTDYAAAIKSFTPYLTPNFAVFLAQDANNRYSSDEIQDRIRTMTGIDGASFNADDVKPLGHGTWLVHLDMRLTERMNNDGSVVKDAEISYVLKVVEYNVDQQHNLYGLALAGFAADPKRIKTFT